MKCFLKAQVHLPMGIFFLITITENLDFTSEEIVSR